MQEAQKKRLVLGAVNCNDPDAVKVDVDEAYKPDVVHDLNIVPWPFSDDQFSEVTCHHIIEHLKELPPVMDELHRVCRADGKIYIEVPHYSSCFANAPEHKMHFSFFSLDSYVREGEKSWMVVERKFRLLSKRLTFHRAYRRYQLHRLINRFPRSYERFWAYIIPAENIIFELQPIKK
jgi:SAM-dependent methyltransferase